MYKQGGGEPGGGKSGGCGVALCSSRSHCCSAAQPSAAAVAAAAAHSASASAAARAVAWTPSSRIWRLWRAFSNLAIGSGAVRRRHVTFSSASLHCRVVLLLRSWGRGKGSS